MLNAEADGPSRAQTWSTLVKRRRALKGERAGIEAEHQRAIDDVNALKMEKRDKAAYQRNAELARDEMQRWRLRHQSAGARIKECEEEERDCRGRLEVVSNEVASAQASLSNAQRDVDSAERSVKAIEDVANQETNKKKVAELKKFRSDFVSRAAAYSANEPQYATWVARDKSEFDGEVDTYNFGISVSSSLKKYRSMLRAEASRRRQQNRHLLDRRDQARERVRVAKVKQQPLQEEYEAAVGQRKAARQEQSDSNARYRDAALRNAMLTRVSNVMGRKGAQQDLKKAGDTVIPDLEGGFITVEAEQLVLAVKAEIESGQALQANVRAIKERLEIVQSKTPLSSVAPCRGVPHGGSHICPIGQQTAVHSVARTPFAERLVRELHRMVNAARTCATVKRALGIADIPSDDETQWMLGVVVCWDTAASEIKVLYAASGQRLKLSRSDGNTIWCHESSSFVDFAGKAGTQKALREAYCKAHPGPDSAETAGQLGRCAAPKMLNYAASGLTPVLVPFEMAEITFEPSALSEHGKLMHSCHKCRFALADWLCGLEAQQSTHQHAFTEAKRALEAEDFEGELAWLPP